MHSKKSIIPKIIILFLGLLAVIYIFFSPIKTEETSSNAVTSNTSKGASENTVSNENISTDNETVQNTVTEEVPETPKDPVEEKLSQMTLDEKIAQIFIIRPESIGSTTELSEDTKNLLSQNPVGGVALFSKNITSPDQLKTFTSSLQANSKTPLFIGIDEEGGLVARIANSKNFDVPKYENMASIGATGDPNNAYNVGKTIGGYLKEYGVNLDFAPIADVNTNPNNSVIRKKSFWKRTKSSSNYGKFSNFWLSRKQYNDYNKTFSRTRRYPNGYT